MSQREDFEAWHKSAYGFCNAWVEALQSYEDLAIDCAWDSWQAAIAHAVPPGHVVVPKEPTEEMKSAFDDEHHRAVFRVESYRAMIAAAPVEAQVEPNR